MSHPCEEESFNSLEEFHEWKAKLEEETNIKWVSRSGAIMLKSGLSSQTLVCYRSGKKRFRGQGKRKTSECSRKLDRYCTSVMTVCQTDNLVQVTYFPTHYGHDDSSQDNCLIGRSEEEIAERLSDGEPPQKIRSGMLQGRRHLSSASASLKESLSDDQKNQPILSLDDWIAEMKAQKSIHFYKKEDDPHSSGISDEEFVVVIMTPIQKRIFQAYGHDRLCVDSTSDSAEYGGYELTTILTVDEFEEGVPVAFCVSSSVNDKVLTVFFEAIKSEIGNCHCNVFMSDVVDIHYHTWKEVMGKPKHHLFSPWLIDRTWQEHLEDIADKEQRKGIYARLKACQVELDEKHFQLEFSSLLETLEMNTERHSLHEYLETFFVDQFDRWAYSHRSNLNINTNMHLESFYRTLKHNYLMVKDSGRVEEPISVLHEYVKECGKSSFNFREINAKISNVPSRHDDGMKIVSEVSPSGKDYCWLVATSVNMQHVICMVTGHICDSTCMIRCDRCFVCLKNMTCSCHDNSIKGNLCEHIHAVAISKEEVIEIEEEVCSLEEKIEPSVTTRSDTVFEKFIEQVLYEDDEEEVVLYKEKQNGPEEEAIDEDYFSSRIKFVEEVEDQVSNSDESPGENMLLVQENVLLRDEDTFSSNKDIPSSPPRLADDRDNLLQETGGGDEDVVKKIDQLLDLVGACYGTDRQKTSLESS
ncbi:Zinc finger protein [Nesidiocoris tenuis]|uniref:Zinc finger protein n=1 Tax=Nesidiocoris tenuis TaxID=355587 RepID=A0ABN7AMR3_9HEMI|nr:Zinc finger protein [Nesidiocoris tenuis]